MNSNTINTTVLTLATLTAASTALAQHAGDIFVENVDGQLTTGLVSANTTIHDHRVFASEFGETFPNFTDEPGFDSDAGQFAPGSQIGFDILTSLRLWDGQDFTTQASVSITVSFANLSVETGNGFVEGFGLPVANNGEWHKHLNFVINQPHTPGIYLMSMQLWSTEQGLATSEPFYIVFNQETDEAIHDEAIEWAEENLVPGIRFHDVDLMAGANNEFAVIGATPGERVTFIYGLRTGSTNIPGCPGTTVGIRNPTIMGSTRADVDGHASISKFVPGAAVGRTVFFGAVEQSTCIVGNIVEHTF